MYHQYFKIGTITTYGHFCETFSSFLPNQKYFLFTYLERKRKRKIIIKNVYK